MTSLKCCSSLYRATGATSLKFRSSFFMERLGRPRSNVVLVCIERLGRPRPNFVLVFLWSDWGDLAQILF